MYYIDNGSMYMNIIRIKYKSDTYIKAHVQYFSRPGGSLLSEEKNCKIPLDCFKFWKKL